MTRTLQHTLMYVVTATVALAVGFSLASVAQAAETDDDQPRLKVTLHAPTVADDAGKLAPRPSRADMKVRFRITPESIEKAISGDSDTMQVILPDSRKLEVPARFMDKRSDKNSSSSKGGKLQNR